jgi:DNA-binding transcriptional LysR family regulator
LGSSEALRRAALGGAGCAFLSTLAVGRELADGSLKKIEVEGLAITRSFYLARRRSRTLSPAAKAFMKTIRQSMLS